MASSCMWVGQAVALKRPRHPSLAAIHSDNLGEALAKFARYKRLVCGEQVSVETSKGEARIRLRRCTSTTRCR